MRGVIVGQVEVLLEVMQANALDYHGWLLLMRVLLKRMAMGVGVATLLAAMPHIGYRAQYLYNRQRSLEAVVDAALAPQQQREDGMVIEEEVEEANQVKCGVPVRFMTCDPGHAMRTPYLFKWIFSREEKLHKPLPPVDGRLVITERHGWFVPLNARTRARMVSLDDDRVLQKPYRRRHLLFLRQFKLARLIDERAAAGVVLHYALSEEEDKRLVLLLRDASDASEQGVELVGAGVSSEVYARSIMLVAGLD